MTMKVAAILVLFCLSLEAVLSGGNPTVAKGKKQIHCSYFTHASLYICYIVSTVCTKRMFPQGNWYFCEHCRKIQKSRICSGHKKVGGHPRSCK